MRHAPGRFFMGISIVVVLALPAFSILFWLGPLSEPLSVLTIMFFALQIPLLLYGRDAAFLKDGVWPRTIYRVSMLSFVLILDLFMVSLVHLLLRLILLFTGLKVSADYTLTPLFALAIVHVFYGLINARILRIRRVKIQQQLFPAQWKGRRIVFFSDTHYGTLNGPRMAEILVSRIMDLKPHLIIFGGDLFDGPQGRYSETLKALSGLQAPLGILAVLGNHDYYYLSRPGSSHELLARQQRRESMNTGEGTLIHQVKKALGWRFLENETVELDGIVFAGLQAFSLNDEQSARACLSRIDPLKPTILLNHKPQLAEEAEQRGIELQLSGHTHGGPVFPVNHIMDSVLKGRHFGSSYVGRMQLDTSSGSGISRWYPRTAGHHEVVLIEV